MKILVADDSKTNLALITSALERLGHDVMAAASGNAAIEIFRNERPDLIILDVVMEGIDGFECARQIRAIDSDNWIPIIFLSASVDDASIAKGIDAGGDDYLTKPFSEITLAAKIQAMQRIAEMRKKLCATTQELEILSTTDTLTGVSNRLEFERRIREKISESNRHHIMIAVLFVDLDHFKTVNDSMGHATGDALLKEAAQRLKDCLRMSDFIARIGGDEFVIILTNIESPADAEDVAQKIIIGLSSVFQLGVYNVRITASIGIACYPYHGSDANTFVQKADVAMYHAKELGRHNYQFYSEELNEKYRHQINLEHELKFALERGQFFLMYQPIYNLLTRKAVGMEALIRWRHPEFGIVSPNIFIPIAEETGLIITIGTWVLKNVCIQGAKWHEQGLKNFLLSVNVSLHQILHDNFFDVITAILQETKMPPNSLELELTESTVITYTTHLKNTINSLRKLGVRISIDDFGTRYSSLTSLRNLPINTIKIDKEFLKDVTTDPKNSIIVKTLAALGNSLSLNVIAEGVQTEEHLQFLVVNGCIQGQGFFLSKSLTADEMTAILKSQEESLAQTENR